MSARPLPLILATCLAVSLAACPKSGPQPGQQADQPEPSAAFGKYRQLNKEAKDLLKQTKRGLAAETVTKTAEGIEQRLIELEPEVNKLPRAERPHARRFVDQTLSTLDAIRDLLDERDQPSP
jgi:hypothetical protein